MKILRDYNLSKLNTFGIATNAKFFVEIRNEQELKELFESLEFKNNKKLFLGGGSNVLFTKDFDGLVILNKLKGTEILDVPTKVGILTGVGEDSENVVIRCMGGEIWHDLVNFSVEHGLWGIENLSLIPGTVGAAPMQNIGAYGAELKDVLENVEACDINTGEKKIFSNKECEFGYRDSVFKNKLKGKYFISAITLKLSKKEKKNLSYKVLQEHLAKNKIEVKNPKHISDAVADIRRSKLPNPEVIPNAGSFFKNVFITSAELKKLQKIFPDMPYFEEPSDASALAGEEKIMKIPAGWLIEQCEWKGKRVGNVGVHDKQALVLVNHGGAKGEEILFLASKIIADVKEKFGLELLPEVNIV